METYYIQTKDPVVMEFVMQMANRKKAVLFTGLPQGFISTHYDSLLIYNKYLNKYTQYSGRDDIIKYVRDDQFKIPVH